jgi:hypothetical protein
MRNLTNIITFLQDKMCSRNWWYTESVLLSVDFEKETEDLNNYIKQINDKYLRRLIIDRKTNYYLGITPLLKI